MLYGGGGSEGGALGSADQIEECGDVTGVEVDNGREDGRPRDDDRLDDDDPEMFSEEVSDKLTCLLTRSTMPFEAS